jgi:hypothetical protein
MIWICLFIPLCIWLGIVVISPLNIYTTGGIAITAFIYLLIELRQVSRQEQVPAPSMDHVPDARFCGFRNGVVRMSKGEGATPLLFIRE